MSSKDADACEKSITKYLVSQNRPYSAIDIFNNLHKAYGKTLVVKTLESLSAKGKIRSKTYGKQTVFVADQAQFPDVDESEMKEMEGSIDQLTSEIHSCRDHCRGMEAELKSLNSALTTEEAQERLAAVNQECSSISDRLDAIKSNDNSVSPEERTEIMTARTKYVKEWRKRKRMANDILNAILEGYPKSKKELYEEIGIETDEDYQVKPPDL